jgi:hypothetical protein
LNEADQRVWATVASIAHRFASRKHLPHLPPSPTDLRTQTSPAPPWAFGPPGRLRAIRAA